MIPRTVSDLDALLDEVTRQSNEVTGLFERLSPEGAAWRPDETRWSAGGHVAHMAIINEAYLGAVTAAGGGVVPSATGPIATLGSRRGSRARWSRRRRSA